MALPVYEGEVTAKTGLGLPDEWQLLHTHIASIVHPSAARRESEMGESIKVVTVGDFEFTITAGRKISAHTFSADGVGEHSMPATVSTKVWIVVKRQGVKIESGIPTTYKPIFDPRTKRTVAGHVGKMQFSETTGALIAAAIAEALAEVTTPEMREILDREYAAFVSVPSTKPSWQTNKRAGFAE